MTIRSDIRDAIIEALNASPPAGVPAATKRRWDPDVPVSAAFISVFFNEESVTLPQGRSSGIAQRTLRLSIQAVFPTTALDSLDDLPEDSLAHIVASLADSDLGGLVSWVQEISTSWQVVKLQVLHAVATVVIQVNYQTKRNDVTVQA